ncbi:class I SAM-dependent methyltransferase [Bradyrhizobium sp. AUGA SZCCT0274]|uniref:class I SAM-dependent methyltransferase n=1 Tax=Bradyrhizobium sp. AUGA SZCCT0274 TaxID=2807670 RepID=UPI0020119A27|nr:class I SAM-dependent methyltransferase [Bradyrhizobium sp. AUGA SZCCT0274]
MSADLAQVLFGQKLPEEGSAFEVGGKRLVMRDGILREGSVEDLGQAQTRDTFGYKWSQKETYRSEHLREKTRAWLVERYGDLLGGLTNHDRCPLLLDAGCGSGFTASLLFGERLRNVAYVGADISGAVDLARETVGGLAGKSLFLQCDLMTLPFAANSFDLVYSEGVLHHTPSTQAAVAKTAALVRPGGLYAIYVYARKAPVREFTDDYVRGLLAGSPSAKAWDEVRPLTLLGKALGDLHIKVNVPEDVKLLGIPKGEIDIQRLFYWYVCKAYYDEKLTVEEMNHINYDWFAPHYSHRQTPADVRSWCENAGLEIERLKVEEAGITVVARRPLASSVV